MEQMHVLMTAANAVLPLVVLIGLGYWLRQIGFFTEGFLKTGNKLVFTLCLPCMMFVNIYDVEGFSAIAWDVVLYSLVLIFLLFLLGIGLALTATGVRKRRGALAQSSFRSNMGIIGLTLAAALGGEEAVAVAAVISGLTVAAFNVLAVLALSMFSEDSRGKLNWGKILKNIVTNPLIIGIALGMLCLLLREIQRAIFGQPVFLLKRDLKFLYTSLNNLKSLTSPFALLVMGGLFTFSAVQEMWKEIASGTFCRLVLAPLLGIGGAILLTRMGVLHCGVNDYPALIALFGSPIAVASAVMAGQMGSDEQLATQLVVWTSLGSIVTIFLTVCILMSMGLLAV